jgi:hypothetical protein
MNLMADLVLYVCNISIITLPLSRSVCVTNIFTTQFCPSACYFFSLDKNILLLTFFTNSEIARKIDHPHLRKPVNRITF